MTTPTDEKTLMKVPPHDLEVERAVLGAVLIEDSVLQSSRVQPSDFYRDAHGTIWKAMVALRHAGTTVDLITLTDALRQAGAIEKIGGATYLSQLMGEVPTSAGFAHHEKIVIQMAQRRAAHKVCDAAIGKCFALADPDAILTECINALAAVRRNDGSQVITYRQLMRSGFDMVEKRAEHPGVLSGIPWGFPEMDRLTDGIHPEVTIIAARPRMGKTAFAMQIAGNAARHFIERGKDERVGIISTEMGAEQLALREIARVSHVPLHNLRSGELDSNEWGRIGDAVGQAVTLPVLLEFKALSDAAAERRIDDWVQMHNVRLIILDYLQLLQASRTYGTREEAVSSISRMLARKRKEYNIPIISLAQLNRGVESRDNKRPGLADLRESGAIEQDADNIFFIHRPEVYQKCSCGVECICGKRGKAEIICEKQRMGDSFIQEFEWTGKWQMFTEKVRR